MIFVTTIDNAQFSGETARDVVQDMASRAWFRSDTKCAYMRDVAERLEMFNGQVIRSSGPRMFLDDLSKAGLIKITETN